MTQPLAGIAIRRATLDDASAVLTIGERADRLFAGHGFPQITALPPAPIEAIRALLAGNDAWIAETNGVPAGFAIAGQAAGQYWLRELAVDPVLGRRGIGTAILATVLENVRSTDRAAVFLSTFREVPFNRPFYERHGFAVVEPESAAPELRRQFFSEVPPGVDPVTRVLMVWRP